MRILRKKRIAKPMLYVIRFVTIPVVLLGSLLLVLGLLMSESGGKLIAAIEAAEW